MFPKSIFFDYSDYDGVDGFSDLHRIFESRVAPVCSFSKHVNCAAPKILSFNFTECPCLPGCISVHFDVETISYGLWRQNLIIPNDDMKLSSFMITGMTHTV